MNKLSLFRSRSRGQSLVEFAISPMVILILLTGAVEFGLALFQYVTMRDAAQEGALYGSIHPGDTGAEADAIKFRVIAAASDVLQLTADDIEVHINGDDCEGLTGGVPNSIEVVVTFAHPITMPLVSSPLMLGTDTIELTARVTDTILQPVCPPPPP